MEQDGYGAIKPVAVAVVFFARKTPCLPLPIPQRPKIGMQTLYSIMIFKIIA